MKQNCSTNWGPIYHGRALQHKRHRVGSNNNYSWKRWEINDINISDYNVCLGLGPPYRSRDVNKFSDLVAFFTSKGVSPNVDMCDL